jgi:hypothetical protein
VFKDMGYASGIGRHGFEGHAEGVLPVGALDVNVSGTGIEVVQGIKIALQMRQRQNFGYPISVNVIAYGQ